MSKAIFITATDTDAGKTWVTTHLIQALLHQRQKCKALKPIACGLNAKAENDDVKILRDAQGLSQSSDINYCSFRKAAAPSIAAQAEGKVIDPKRLIKWCNIQSKEVDLCLIEAIGGLMVPITPNYLVSDWLKDVPNMPVILVVGATLGCINHTLLSLSHLASIERNPAWVIINHHDGKQDIHAIKHAISPYITHQDRLLICEHNSPETLAPLLTWLTAQIQ